MTDFLLWDLRGPGVKGCCCAGSNTPELDYYCCCRGVGDEDDYDRFVAAEMPFLERAWAIQNDDEDAAWGWVDLGYQSGLMTRMHQYYCGA